MRKNGTPSRSMDGPRKRIAGRPIDATAGLLPSRLSDAIWRVCAPRSSSRPHRTCRRSKKSRAETMNPLKSLNGYGQVVWLDFLSRRFIADGSLKRLIDEDGLAGATSNPSIFEKAIVNSGDYDTALAGAAK